MDNSILESYLEERKLNTESPTILVIDECIEKLLVNNLNAIYSDYVVVAIAGAFSETLYKIGYGLLVSDSATPYSKIQKEVGVAQLEKMSVIAKWVHKEVKQETLTKYGHSEVLDVEGTKTLLQSLYKNYFHEFTDESY